MDQDEAYNDYEDDPDIPMIDEMFLKDDAEISLSSSKST